MGGAGWFFLILFLILLVWAGWFGWKFYNARRHQDTLNLKAWQTYIPFMHAPSTSTNYPTPRSAGPFEWIKDKIAGLTNKRSQTGGFEESRGLEGQYQGLNEGGRGRGRGAEDDAWDSRVGNGRDEDPYGPGHHGAGYEEQELGLSDPGHGHSRNESGPYGGSSDYMAGSTSYGGASRGRSAERSGGLDPFSDANQAPSLRSVSPRPDLNTSTQGHRRNDTLESDGNTSPISTRKSVFREDVS